MMKFKDVKVSYGLQWLPSITGDVRWITPGARYDRLLDAVAALEIQRETHPHLEVRVVRLETTTTAEPVNN